MKIRPALRYWWLVVLMTLAAVGAAVAVTNEATPLYEARGTYVIGPANSLSEPETIVRSFDSLQGQGIVPTLVELLSSETIATSVGADIGFSPSQVENYEVVANVLSASNTLELTVVGPNAVGVQRLAEGIGSRASTLFEDLYSVYQIVPLDVPGEPEEPFSPDPLRNAVLGALLGLTAGAGLAVLVSQNAQPRRRAGRGFLGRRFRRSGEDAERRRPPGPAPAPHEVGEAVPRAPTRG